MTQQIITILSIVLACGGFWTFIQFIISRHDGKKEAMKDLQLAVEKLQKEAEDNRNNMSLQSEALMSMAQDRIIYLGKEFLAQGYIPIQDHSNLKRMADAYKALGGNDVVKLIMDEVDKLPHSKGEK